MSDVYLGIDLGTQSIKCIFIELIDNINENNSEKIGKIILKGQSSSFDVISEKNGYAEQDPSLWITGLKEALSNAFQVDNTIKNRIRAISVSGQQHGLVSINREGNVIRPCMLWCDTRAEIEAKDITNFSGRYIPPGFTAPKIMWMINHEIENYELTDNFMLPHDYLNFYLSNKIIFSMECGDASGTGLIDYNTKDWDHKSINFIHSTLQNKLPIKLLEPRSILGYVDEIIARELDISYHNNYQNILITPGCGDNAMTMLGMSSISNTNELFSSSNSRLLISLGTSGTLMLTSQDPIIDSSGGVALFADATGNWLSLVCIQNCTMVPEEIFLTVSSTLSLDSSNVDKNNQRSTLIDLASLESPGCNGLTLLPYFSSGGERTPNWPNSTGCLIGLRHGYLQRSGLLYRAALEGVTYALYRGFNHLQEIFQQQQQQQNSNNNPNQLSYNEICVVGGGSNNILWKQIISDIFQLPVISYDSEISNNAAAIGAAVQAIAIITGVPFFNVQIQNNHQNFKNIPNLDEESQMNYKYGYERHVRVSNLIFER